MVHARHNISRIGLQECVGAQNVPTTDRPTKKACQPQRATSCMCTKWAKVLWWNNNNKLMLCMKEQSIALVVSITLVKELNRSELESVSQKIQTWERTSAKFWSKNRITVSCLVNPNRLDRHKRNINKTFRSWLCQRDLCANPTCFSFPNTSFNFPCQVCEKACGKSKANQCGKSKANHDICKTLTQQNFALTSPNNPHNFYFVKNLTAHFSVVKIRVKLLFALHSSTCKSTLCRDGRLA